jgi:glutamate carboxypeptidase
VCYLSDLEKICKINSFTKNKDGVDGVATVMQVWMEALGYKTNTYEREHIGNHQLFKSQKVDGVKILLLGHNDTVFAEGEFDKFHQNESWVYGPGTCDMKGGNIVALESLRSIYKRYGVIKNIDFFLVSDEESGSDDSKSITMQIAKDYDYCFVFEAAGENLEVVTGRKGVGTFTITIEGKASHAGVRYSDGISANLEASYKLQELTKLTNLDIGTTLNVGKIVGGIGANTISPKCELLLEIRYRTNEERDRLLKALKDITNTSYVKGTKAALSGLIQRDVMEPNSSQQRLISKIQDIVGYDVKSEQRGGVSDANIVASCGVTTIDGFGPFGDGDHTIHERALKSSFAQRIDMVSKIFDFHQSNGYRF